MPSRHVRPPSFEVAKPMLAAPPDADPPDLEDGDRRLADGLRVRLDLRLVLAVARSSAGRARGAG